MQVIPHVTNAIKAKFRGLEEQTDADVVITELGGTIGDIEGHPFVEAIRQYKKDAGAGIVCYLHVSLVPYIAAAHEVKTKPTQHAVKELRSFGIIRQYKKDAGAGIVCYLHVSLVPYIAAAHEVKTKPTQHAVKELRSFGIQPDIIVLRSDHHIEDDVRAKIA